MDQSKAQKELEAKAHVDIEILHKGKIVSLKRETLAWDGKDPHQFEIVEHPGAVALLPIDENGHLILIKQWRRPAGRILYEIPAGTFDGHEEVTSCAQRELQEEIGYKAGKLKPLGGFFPSCGFCNEYVHLFLAQDLHPSQLPKDPHEAIDLAPTPLKNALAMVDQEEIEDLKTLYAILRYHRMVEHE